MAQRKVVITTIIDDLTDEEIPEDQAVELHFGWSGVNYKIDLSKPNADKFEKQMKQYVEAAARVSGGRGRPRGTGSKRADSGSGRSKEELQAIRDWAAKNGHEVSPRGRIAAPVLEAFDQSHQSAPSVPADE